MITMKRPITAHNLSGNITPLTKNELLVRAFSDSMHCYQHILLKIETKNQNLLNNMKKKE